MCQVLTIFYGPKEDPGVNELGQKSLKPSTRVGARPTPWARPLPRGHLGDPPDLFPMPKPLIYTETPRT